MILVAHEQSSAELIPLIIKQGIPAMKDKLKFGDYAFNGLGPKGSTTAVGIERKKIHDMLACIEDARYNKQRVGMNEHYSPNHSYLILEGLWKCHEGGFLMEGFKDEKTEKLLVSMGVGSREVVSWTICKPGGRPVMYAKLFRYLTSVALSGVHVILTRGPLQTAQNIVELFHWHQKKWENHTSMLAAHQFSLPSLSGRPSLVRLWAGDIDGVGIKGSLEADKIFKRPYDVAMADVEDWMKLPGVGRETARDFVLQILGRKR